jgi:hypothetical protein
MPHHRKRHNITAERLTAITGPDTGHKPFQCLHCGKYYGRRSATAKREMNFVDAVSPFLTMFNLETSFSGTNEINTPRS